MTATDIILTNRKERVQIIKTSSSNNDTSLKETSPKS